MAPRRFASYLVLTELVAASGLLLSLRYAHYSGSAAGRVVLILGLAVLFEELSQKASALRIKLSAHLRADMTSVWSFSAAIALPPAYGALTVIVLLLYLWTRFQRASGAQIYRKVGTASIILISCFAAGLCMRVMVGHTAVIPGALTSGLAVGVSLIVYTVVNRGLITGALLLSGVRGRSLVGTWDDNLLEIATLCLGGLTALAIIHQPILAALVLLPLVLLQRGALVRQLEVAASTDSKTGLLNAIAWEHLALRDLVRSQREAKPMAVLIIDVDRFKWVNDVHGHMTGDIVLKAIGEALTHELRGYDTVGRFGGEEFVASLPNATDASALMVAERVRTRINQIRISHLVPLSDPATDRQLAVSIGVACSPADGAELSDLLHQADAALYVAKDNGRNRVELADRGADGPSQEVAVA